MEAVTRMSALLFISLFQSAIGRGQKEFGGRVLMR